MNKIREMQTFVAVVEAGSFTAATEATDLSKTAVSRTIADLERRLGCLLLQRTTRRISLTEDGRLFFVRAKELLSQIDEFESEIATRRGEASGTLKINAPLTFGVLHLAPLWGLYLREHPKVKLDITLDDRFVDLVHEGYDLGIRINNQANSALVSRQLASTRMVLCASRTYLRRNGTPRHPSELVRHEVIAYNNWSNEWQFSGPEGPVRVTIRPRMQANNGDTCRLAALHHQGLILQPDFLVGADIHSGNLIEVLPQFLAGEIGIHAVYPSRKYLPIKVRTMIDFLAMRLRAPAWHLPRPAS